MSTFIRRIFGRNALKVNEAVNKEKSLYDLEEDQKGVDRALLAYGYRVFLRYNASKTEFLIQQLSQRKKTVFSLVPLLLHITTEHLLGSPDAGRLSPCGIFSYEMNQMTIDCFKEVFPRIPVPEFSLMSAFDAALPIKSVSLMGSMGSIAQNTKSDFDYWLIIDSSSFTPEKMSYFKEKLQAIESWALNYAGAEVHFFPLDLAKVRNNDFGAAGGESSGTAQGKLLKEEFYRTMTLVAGQLPLWWVMPPGVTDDDYVRLTGMIDSTSRVDETRLIDMGNVFNISLGEFYGAAVWQINKTIGSPFKSVLKMALLEEYMFNHGSKGILCTELKARLLANEQNIMVLDPYLLMFDRVSAYLTEQGRADDLDLLRRSLYLKVNPGLTLADFRNKELPRKKQVMLNLVKQWGWSHHEIEDLNKSRFWSYRQTQSFSKEINNFIVRTYRNVSTELKIQKKEAGLTISQRDLTVLGRKLYIHYSKRTNKIETTKNVIDDALALDRITFQAHRNQAGKKIWAVYRALLSRASISNGIGAPSLLHESAYLAEVLIWLVNNQLHDSHTSINLNTSSGNVTTECTVPEIQTILKEMHEFFPPVRYGDIPEEEYLHRPHITKMYLVINLDEPDRVKKVMQTGLCYQNNWGELFYKNFDNYNDGLNVARNFIRKRFAFDTMGLPSNFKIYIPDRDFRYIIGPKINSFLGLKMVG